MYKKIIFLMACLLGHYCYAFDFNQCMRVSKNTVDMQQCIDNAKKPQETELNRLYKNLINLSQEETNFSIEKLKESQQLWFKFRDSNCSIYNQGSIASILNGKCSIAVTQRRIQELQKLCQGIGDTPLCK